MADTRRHLLRNADANGLAEIFLVSAAVTIVFIRVFLYLTGYPQLGGSGLHIAHMLWGGLLLAAALFLLLFTLNRRSKYAAALIGGIGFGLFIDELGKFITADNNYFYQPTYALIYLVFVGLYFLIKKLITAKELSATEYTVNSLELLKEVAANDFSPQEKERLLAYLERAAKDGKEVSDLIHFTKDAQITGKEERSYYASLKKYFFTHYNSLINQQWFTRVVFIIFTVELVLNILGVADFVVQSHFVEPAAYNFFDWGFLLSYGTASVLLITGLIVYPYRHLQGLRWFERATLVGIFAVGFFNFYHDQLLALIGIIGNVVILYAVSVLIAAAEQTRL